MNIKEKYNELIEYIKNNNLNYYSISYIDSNYEFETHTFTPSNKLNNVYSVSKSIISYGIGILYDKGLLKLDSLLTEILKDEINFSYREKWDKVTIKSLLDQTVGYKDSKMMGESKYLIEEDPLEFALNIKLEYQIEKRFQYSNVSFYLLARVIEHITNKSLDEFLNEYLFKPLDFCGHAIGKDKYNHAFGATDMFYNTLDLSKFGLVYALNGNYENKKLLSDEWINLTYQTHSNNKERNYTLGFWKNINDDEIYADGANGQSIFIIKGCGAIALSGYQNDIRISTLYDLFLKKDNSIE